MYFSDGQHLFLGFSSDDTSCYGLVEWLGMDEDEALDPAYFDLEAQNKRLQNWKKS